MSFKNSIPDNFLAHITLLDRNMSAKTYISKIMRAADARFTETLAAAKKGLINSTFKRKYMSRRGGDSGPLPYPPFSPHLLLWSDIQSS
jgi:hypothetical protein